MKWLWELFFGKKMSTGAVLASFEKHLKHLEEVAMNNAELASKSKARITKLEAKAALAEKEVAHSTAVRTRFAELIAAPATE